MIATYPSRCLKIYTNKHKISKNTQKSDRNNNENSNEKRIVK